MVKVCFKCKKTKPLGSFYYHTAMADGHLGKCKSCTKKDGKMRWGDPEARERIRAYDLERSKDPARKANVYLYNLNSKAKHPKKWKSRRKIGNAVRDGRLDRQPCESCQSIKSEAHHTDYRKPLQVKWLCFVHHRIAHGQRPATSNPL